MNLQHNGLFRPRLIHLLYLLLYKCICFSKTTKLIFVAKRASAEEIDRWRRDYWRLRKKYSNKEIAEKLDVNAANLSALGKGTLNKKGKPKNPGKEFIEKFYLTYPELTEPPEDQQAGSDTNKGQQGSQREEQTSHKAEGPPPGHQANWDDSARLRNELFSLYKDNDAFFKAEYSTMNKTILILTQEVAFYRKQTNPGPDDSSQ